MYHFLYPWVFFFRFFLFLFFSKTINRARANARLSNNFTIKLACFIIFLCLNQYDVSSCKRNLYNVQAHSGKYKDWFNCDVLTPTHHMCVNGSTKLRNIFTLSRQWKKIVQWQYFKFTMWTYLPKQKRDDIFPNRIWKNFKYGWPRYSWLDTMCKMHTKKSKIIYIHFEY